MIAAGVKTSSCSQTSREPSDFNFRTLPWLPRTKQLFNCLLVMKIVRYEPITTDGSNVLLQFTNVWSSLFSKESASGSFVRASLRYDLLTH